MNESRDGRFVPHSVRVLQYTYGGAHRSGIESYLLGAQGEIAKAGIRFDYLFRYQSPLGSGSSATDHGSEIYSLEVPEDANPLVRQFIELRRLARFFRNHKYDVVEINMTSAFMCIQAAAIARLNGTRVRIVHAHDSVKHESWKKRLLKVPATPLVRAVATDHWACSLDAARYLFGAKGASPGKWFLAKNAIQAERFEFDASKRAYWRSAWALPEQSAPVIGMLGRLTQQKDPERAITIFKGFSRRNPRATLAIVGDGVLRGEMETLTRELGIADSVRFVGAQNDVQGVLSGFDVLLAPSAHEGFPLVALEAQASGLRAVTSDAFPAESNLDGRITILGSDSGLEDWLDALDRQLKLGRSSDGVELLRASGYTTDTAGIELRREYASIFDRWGLH